MSPKLRREPLRTQLRDLLLERILDGDLEPGAQIDLGKLTDEWDVSRTPLREALLTLEEEGLVTSQRGKGFYVWELSATEAVNLYQIAGGLERLAVRTTPSVHRLDLARMRETNEELRAVQGKPKEMIRLDGIFHRELVRGTSNEDLLEFIRKVRNRLYRYRSYGYEYVVSHGTDEKRISVDEHAAIVDRLDEGVLPEAANLLEEHWERGTELMQRWLDNPEEGPSSG